VGERSRRRQQSGLSYLSEPVLRSLHLQIWSKSNSFFWFTGSWLTGTLPQNKASVNLPTFCQYFCELKFNSPELVIWPNKQTNSNTHLINFDGEVSLSTNSVSLATKSPSGEERPSQETWKSTESQERSRDSGTERDPLGTPLAINLVCSKRTDWAKCKPE